MPFLWNLTIFVGLVCNGIECVEHRTEALGSFHQKFRVFIRHQRSENSPAITQNSPAKFCLFPERANPFQNNPPVTLQYSLATPVLNENPFRFLFRLLDQK